MGARLSLGVMVLLTAICTPASAQVLQVGDYQLVSQRRITLTVYEYEYRARLAVNGPAITGATATVTSLSPATTVIDDALSFGPIGANASALSIDTFRFRHDRTVPFNLANLVWSVQATTANAAPTVDAGADQSVSLSLPATLDATTADDGQPNPPGALTFAWTQQRGPGVATFAAPAAEDTTVSFSAAGTYVLRLTVGDGVLTAADEVTITVNAPGILSLAPASGQQGQTVDVTVTGSFTTWTPATTTAAISGAGVTISQLTVTSSTQLTARLVIDGTAPVGARIFTATTGSEIVTGAFQVLASGALITQVSPDQGQQGQALAVTITGTETHFQQGVTTATFGAGIGVGAVTVASPTSATVTLTIDPAATVGPRTITLTTGGEQVGRVDGFTVQPGTPVLLSVTPGTANPDETLDVFVTGRFTHFEDGLTTASFGAGGIRVNAVTVTSPTAAMVNITVDPLASTGPRTVTLTTGAEVASLAGAFAVRSLATILDVDPDSGQQGQTLNVTVFGDSTHFAQGVTTASFGSDIVVNSVTVNASFSAAVNITILASATPGPRTVTMTTIGESPSLPGAFTVTPGTLDLTLVTPSSAQQGQTLNVQVQGTLTTFAPGVTTASFGAGITINGVTVGSPTSATVNITIDPLAATGLRSVTLTTGPQVVTRAGGFQVLAGPATISAVAPVSAQQGDSLTLTITGQDTHFAPGLTTASFGPGINVGTVTVTGPTSATVDIAIDPAAGVGPRLVQVTTQGEIAQRVDGFTVLAGTPTILTVAPNTGQQGQTVDVTVTGRFTSWNPATTIAFFGNGTTVSLLTVLSPTSIQAQVVIDPTTPAGPRTITILTGGETVTSAFQVLPGNATLTQVSPAQGLQGQTLDVVVTGTGTHFQQGVTTASFGAGVVVNAVNVTSPTSATVSLSVQAAATVGPRAVTLTTGGEQATRVDGFTVAPGTIDITSVAPGTGQQGQTLDVAIAAQFTTFVQGSTVASFGAGVTVNGVTVVSATSATVNITIAPTAFTGVRTITVTTGSEIVTEVNGFAIQAGPATLSTVLPASAQQGQSLTVTVTGDQTHFAQGVTTAAFGSDVVINSVTVSGPTSATVAITVPGGAALGPRTVTLATEGETASRPGGFTVTPGTLDITSVTPPTGRQGQTLDVVVQGLFTNFVQGATTATFGAGVTVNSVSVASPTSTSINITINPTAFTGFRSVTLTTGSEIVTEPNGFQVQAGPATITQLNPAQGVQGATLNVVTTGLDTHFAQGVTTASFGPGITVNGVTVTSATSASINITIAAGASVGARAVTVTTDGENAPAAGGFTVLAGTTDITSITPSTGQQGQTLNVTVLGQFTTFAQGVTSADFGPGIAVNSVTVNSATSATVSLTISPTAFAGSRNVTLTTGTEIVTRPSGFFVQPGPATLTSLSPNQGIQGQTLNVVVTGLATHFAPGVTTAFFGGDITVNGVTVASATSATVNITIGPFASAGFRSVTLTTQGETASIGNGFTVVAGTPVLTLVSPGTGAQGQTLDVAVTGQFTTFVQGVTAAGFGPGITVNGVTVASPTSATVNISIAPTAGLFTRTVTLTTGREVASSGGGLNSFFVVTAGTATITQIDPPSGRRGQTVNVTVTGSGTSFTPGVTAATFGAGIGVSGINVVGPTSAIVTLVIDPDAPLGPRSVSLFTGGETATIVDGFTVLAGLPRISSVSPITARQGDTLNVAVTGQFTSFAQGSTTADLGPGITVNTVTVASATQATVNITIGVGAAPGSRTVVMTTGGESAQGVGLFTVLPGLPTLLSVNPSVGTQGQSLTVVLTGQFTTFTPGVTTASFGSGVTVGVVTVNGPTLASVPITIQPGAAPGARAVTVTTGGEQVSLPAGFTIQQGTPQITVIQPNTGRTNQAVTVNVTAQFTSFQGGVTQATFGPGISVGGAAEGTAGPVTVNGATSLSAQLQIAAGATLGTRTVTVQTGTEIITVPDGFTVTTVDTTAPSVLTISPANGATGVALNANVVVQFNEPINRTTVTATTFRLRDNTTGLFVPATVSVDVTGRIATLVPGVLLGVSRSHSIQLVGSTGGIADESGNLLPFTSTFSFTTGFETDTTGPTLQHTSPTPNATGVPTNTNVTLRFDRPVNRISVPAGFRLLQGATPVPANLTFSDGDRIVTLDPVSTLTVSTAYSVLVGAQVQDTAGNPLSNPTTFTFTTGTVVDTTAPTVVSRRPESGDLGVGTNVVVRLGFSEPISAVSLNDSTFRLFHSSSNQRQLATVVVAPDGLSATLTPLEGLLPHTTYRYDASFADPAGNANFLGSFSFTTGPGPDLTGPTVLNALPLDGSTGVPLNLRVVARLSETIDTFSVSAATVQVVPAVPGTVTLNASDRVTLRFAPTANLAPSTAYALTISGLRDPTGNVMAPFTTSFTTGTTADTTAPTLTMVPIPGSTNVPVTTPIVFTVNEPISAGAVGPSSMQIQAVMPGVGQFDIAGTFLVNAAATQITFTPFGQYPPGTTVRVFTNSNSTIQDLAGNLLPFQNLSFTTASTQDTTPPTVVSVSPSNGTTGVGPRSDVVLTFSEAIRSTTATSSNFALYNGGTLISTSVSRAADGRTVILSATLPANRTITVVAASGVQDLAGNPLVDFTSTFTTGEQIESQVPSVTVMRPGNGATGVPVSSTVTLYTTEPLDPSTIPAALKVSQNGVLITGAVQVSAGGEAIHFVPDASLTPSAIIQVFLTTDAQDLDGNPVSAFSGQFTVAPDPAITALSIVRTVPGSGQTGLPTNARFEIEFSEALNPATVNDTNISLRLSATNGVVPATVSLAGNARIVRVVPSAALTPATTYIVRVLTGVTDTQGSALPFQSAFSFTTGATADTSQPTVVRVSPPAGTTDIGANALIRVEFSEAINPISVTGATIAVTGGPVTIVPASITFNTGDTLATLAPLQPLPDSTVITVSIAGVTDRAGNAVVPLVSTFTTDTQADTQAPVLISRTPELSATDVPTTPVLQFQFDEPLDPLVVFEASQVTLRDNLTSQLVAGTVTLSADLRLVSFVPTSPLLMARTYSFRFNSAQDLAGNSSFSHQTSFTTTTVPDTTGPTVVATFPAAGATGIPTNAVLQIRFNEPMQPSSLSQIALASGGPLAATVSLSDGNRLATITPSALLAGGTPHTLTIGAVRDLAGNPLGVPVVVAFTTAPGIDLVAPTVIARRPESSDLGVGTNIAVRVVFSEPVNPLSLTLSTFRLFHQQSSQLQPASVVVAPDGLSATLTPVAPLLAHTQYRYDLSYTDRAANQGFTGSIPFTTSGGADVTGPTVLGAVPLAGSTAVPLNLRVVARFNEALEQSSVSGAAVQFTPPVAGDVTLDSDRVTLRFVPAANLAPSTAYTMTISGLRDATGNVMSPFAVSFTTGTAADTTAPTATINPVNGATGISVTAPIVITLSEPITAGAVGPASIPVQATVPLVGSLDMAGIYSVNPAGTQITFAPLGPYPGNTQIRVFLNNNGSIRDLAGNLLAFQAPSFTTAATTDTTPPTVTSVSPTNGTTGVGPRAEVVLTFSEALRSTTINSNTFALYSGATPLPIGVTRASDNRTVVLSATLPPNQAITIVATSGVQDLSGNALADFTSVFHTGEQIEATSPTIVTMRPASGATGVPSTSSITFFASEPLRATTVAGSLLVVQNGIAWPGSVSVIADGEAIEFVPDQPFPPGAIVQAFVATSAQDLDGNAVSAFSGQFTIAPDPTTVGPSVVRISPSQSATGLPTNVRFEIEFSEPLNPATVVEANVSLRLNATNAIVPATISLVGGGRVVRLAPTAPLTASTNYVMRVTTGLTDQQGVGLVFPQAFSFATGTTVDSTAPTVVRVSPPTSSTAVGSNALIRVQFGERVSPLSVSGATIAVTAGPLTIVPAAISFDTSDTMVTLTPQQPLPDSTLVTITVTGVTDLAGNVVAPLTSTFTTDLSADTAAPTVVDQNPTAFVTDFPVNGVFEITLSEPVDPVTAFDARTNFVRDNTTSLAVASTISLSPDGRTIAIAPTAALQPSRSYSWILNAIPDLAGNTAFTGNLQTTTASGADTTAPMVVATTPANGLATAPTNTRMQILFSEAVQSGQLGGITLTEGGTPVPVTVDLSNGNRTATVNVGRLLLPNTTFVLTIAGVRDSSNNVLGASATVTFVTGSGVDRTAGQTVTVTPPDLQTGVPVSVQPTIQFDDRVDPVYVLSTASALTLQVAATSANVPFTLALSPDLTTITLVPVAPLAAGTQYRITVNSVQDLAGNTLPFRQTRFTTQ